MEDGVFPKARSLCETALLGVALFTRGSLAGTPLHRFALLSSGLRLHRSFIGVHGCVVFMEEGRGDLHVVCGDVHGCVCLF